MDENKDKLINNKADSDEVMEETIVFKREPDDIIIQRQPAVRQRTTPAEQQKKSENTQIQGGAVIRPLKPQQPNRPIQQTVIQPQNRSQTQSQPQRPVQQRQPQINQTQSRAPVQQSQRQAQTQTPRPVNQTQSRPAQTMQNGSQQRPVNVNGIQSQSQRPVQSQQRPVQNQQPQRPAQSSQTQRQSQQSVRPVPTSNGGAGNQPPSGSNTRRTANQPDNLPVRRQPAPVRSEPEVNNDWDRVEREAERREYARDTASSTIMSAVKAVIYIVFVIAISVPLSIFVINTANDVFAFVKEEKIVEVTIPEYTTIEDLADILGEAGVIKYPWAFKLWSNVKEKKNIEAGYYPEFVAGTYEVNTNQNYDYLRATFKKSTKRETVDIMIPEGYTVDEIIDLLVANGISTREELVDVINNYPFEYRFIDELTVSSDRTYRLEGYLFPDTYQFYKNSSAATAIDKFLQNFNKKFAEEYYDRCSDLGLTVDEAITLASMIEKEARYASDLGNVSSVFHNRLKYKATFPYLNSDATVAYAIQHDSGSRPDNLTGDDMDYDSPYNTYTHKGLPPGPISNPGLNSIRYALYPDDSDYFYFVSDSSGHMLFAKTQDEHLKNINIARGK